MKKRLSLFLPAFAVLVLAVFFANIFVTYAQPMQDERLDLSPLKDISEVEVVDRSAELGWTFFTQEGDVITPLVYDDFGSYNGLQYPGQTFYYARVMVEELDSATLSLATVNRNFSVFLDGVLIYTDCPEQDNRIGYLALPTRDWERSESIVVSLPENYVGKTLTIAQSTPPYAETPRMATRAMPSTVTLYCSYAYESVLIAESFQTAYISAVAYVIGLILLFFFTRSLLQRKPNAGLFLLALTVFLAMAANMYNVSYYLRYFGVGHFLSTDLLCRWLTQAALMFFLCARTQKGRILAWSYSGVYALLVVLRIVLQVYWNMYFTQFQTWLSLICDATGFITLVLLLIIAWINCAAGSRFHRWFAPLCTLGIAVYVIFQLAMPGRAAFLSELHSALSSLSLQIYTWPLSCLMGVLSVLLTAAQIIREELNTHAEKRLMKEMTAMAQQRYENLRRHNEEIMMLRHDMKRHFNLLRQTTTDPNTAAYLDDLIGQNESIRPVICSGNDLLDTILCGRLNSAMDAGIHVEILRADAPASLPLTQADTCSMMMNLIDNAIAAASASSQKSIKLDLHQKSGFFVFVCENSVKANSVAATIEKTVPKHGLGLKIIRQIAERYGCLLTTEVEATTYKVSLAIPLDQPCK